MCGICGVINLNNQKIDVQVLKRMNNVLAHRGPDDEGYHTSNNVGLAMRRLSIIDLETGNQPIYNEDKSISVTCNGEIYNFLELRKDLEKKHKFNTKSDTEVILHLYEEYGTDCLKHLRGMYAISLWDEKNKILLLARDRIGKKPLYYTRINSSFYYSSEIKSFLEIPGFKKDINLKAIHYYLTYQYIPGPMTIWNGVYRLDPASYLVLKPNGEEKIAKYWNIDLRKKTSLSFEESKNELRRILTEATKLRLISDVPLGAFLSGGIDSSIVVGLMSRLSNKPVKTFSIGFEEKEFSELEYAREVAKRFKTEHNELIVKPNYIDILPKIVWHYDQPYADCSALPSYYVAMMTRKHVKVALNGDGGDENFAGYLRYKALKISNIISLPFKIIPDGIIRLFLNKINMNESVDAKRFTRYLHRFIRPLKHPPHRRNLIWHAFFTNELKSFVYSDDMNSRFKDDDSYSHLEDLFLSSPAKTIIDKTLYSDLTSYLPDDLLIKMDIASMANSLEARSPFLDQKFIEFTSTLPSEWKLKHLKSKYILKETFRDILPESIMKRGKQGFSIPVGKWFKKDLKDYFRDIVLSQKAMNRGYFNRKNINKLFNDHVEGRADYGYCLWALLMLELWHKVFIDSDFKM